MKIFFKIYIFLTIATLILLLLGSVIMVALGHGHEHVPTLLLSAMITTFANAAVLVLALVFCVVFNINIW